MRLDQCAAKVFQADSVLERRATVTTRAQMRPGLCSGLRWEGHRRSGSISTRQYAPARAKKDGSIHDRDDVLQTPGQRICGLELSTREDVAERISTTEWNVHAVSERKTILQVSESDRYRWAAGLGLPRQRPHPPRRFRQIPPRVRRCWVLGVAWWSLGSEW